MVMLNVNLCKKKKKKLIQAYSFARQGTIIAAKDACY